MFGGLMLPWGKQPIAQVWIKPYIRESFSFRKAPKNGNRIVL